MTDTNNGWTAAKIGQDLHDTDDEDIQESPSYWWVPYVDDDEILRCLLVLKEHYSPDEMADHLGADRHDAPDRVEDTDLFRTLFRTGAGLTIHRALRDSDLDRQNSIVGLDSPDDASGTSKLLRLVDRIESGYIGYMFGHMGNGKTDFAIYIAELWTRMNGEVEIASNIRSFERAKTIERFVNLREWVDVGSQKLFIWDEASSNASGYSSDAHKVTEKLPRVLQSFRKNRCNLIIIGHTGKDVHPHFRRQSQDLIHKESKERATVYGDLKDSGEPQDKKFSISGIEPTAWEYDTREMSRWFWES